MEINCSRPCNNTEMNDSHFVQFQSHENLNQVIPFGITICSLNAFFSFTALLGNAAILLTIWKTSSLHSAANILLTSLAVSDLAVGLLVQPLFIAAMQSGIPTIILVFNILVYFFCCASFFTITAITMDRLLVLQLHLRYHAVMTTFRVSRVVIFIWILSGVCTLLSFLSSRIRFVLPVLVISLLAGNFVVYFKIYLIARRHQRQIQHQHQHQRQASNENIVRVTRFKKTAFNTFLVYILLLCCYIPYNFVALYGGISAIVHFTLVTLVFLNSSLNPLLYCWRDREIRTAVKQLFCR